MSCNCEGKKYSISMGCCELVLAPIENYYTKYQIDKMIESATTSGCCITPEEVDEKIEEAVSGIYTKSETSSKTEIDDALVLKQNTLSAGTNISINDNVISATDTKYVAGDYITIDTANTISTSGLVTVVDNEVPAFSAENLVMYDGGYPSSSGEQYSYNQSTDAVLVYFSVQGSLYKYKTKIQVVDTGNTKTSGETNTLTISQMNPTRLNPLPDYLTVENVDTRQWLFKTNEGYRISHLSSMMYYDGDPYYNINVYISGTPTTYMSGQSESVIENEIYPELASKANKIQAGSAITIIRDVVNSADTINVKVETSVKGGSMLPVASYALYSALQSKADTTYVQNNYMSKNQIWCGSEQEWSQISGSTTNGTIYLVY